MATKRAERNEAAESAYTIAHSQVLELLAELQDYVEDKPAPSEENRIDWGHVGDLNYLKGKLEELTEGFGLDV
jgi:hypothetical protein